MMWGILLPWRGPTRAFQHAQKATAHALYQQISYVPIVCYRIYERCQCKIQALVVSSHPFASPFSTSTSFGLSSSLPSNFGCMRHCLAGMPSRKKPSISSILLPVTSPTQNHTYASVMQHNSVYHGVMPRPVLMVQKGALLANQPPFSLEALP